MIIMESAPKKIALNTVISFSARVLGTALALVSIGLIARHLGPSGFGEYSLVLAFLYTFIIVGQFGLYPLLLRELSQREDKAALLSDFFSLRLYLLVSVMALTPFAALLFPYSMKVIQGIGIAAVGFLFMGLSQLLMAVFQHFLSVWRASLAEVVGRAAQAALVYLVVVLGLGFFSVLWVFSVVTFIIFSLNLVFALRLLRFRIVWIPWWKIKEFFRKAFPIALSIVLTLIYFKLDTIILSIPQINSASTDPARDVGVYNVAYRVLEGLIFFPAMFVGLIMPFLSRYFKEDWQRFENIFRQAHSIVILATLPLVGALWILAEPIVILIGGAEFVAAAPVLKILSIAIGFIFLGNLYGQAVVAQGREKKAAWVYGGGVVVNIAANILIIPFLRELGAALTTVLTEAMVTLFLFLIIKRGFGLGVSCSKLSKAALASALMFVFLIYFNFLSLFVLIVSGIVIYFGLLFLLGGITVKEIKIMIGRNLESGI